MACKIGHKIGPLKVGPKIFFWEEKRLLAG